MDELLEQFLIEARDLIVEAQDELAALGTAPGDRAIIDRAFRAVHTLKGSVAVFDMAPALRMLHAAEDVLERARSGAVLLEQTAIAALVDCLDQADRWVDAMEEQGALQPEAAATAAALIERLGGEAGSSAIAATPASAWATTLATQLSVADGDRPALTAFRYTPAADCFFRGDDPMAIVAAVPGLLALSCEPREPWPTLDAVEPFTCNIVLAGLSSEPPDTVQAVFRFVIDQVEVGAVVAAAGRAVDAAEMGAMGAGAAGAGRALRVDARRVEALGDGVGELIAANTALAALAARARRGDDDLAAGIAAVHSTFDRVIGEMHRAIVAVRMVSVGPTLRRLPRMVREIAGATGRNVSLKISGETTEIDKSIADELFEPLLHLVRNAVDHGIERPPERLAAGKPGQGAIFLAVARAGDQVRITLSDDGKGIDPDRIRAVAVERGVIDAEAALALDAAGALRLIFAPGFSTAVTVSDVSGRGVGMDAVQSAIDRLGGRIEIVSRVGEGTTVRLFLPLHAITTKLLIVEVGGDRFGVPLDHVVETASLSLQSVFAIGRGRACVHRDRTLPLLSLAHLLDPAGAEQGKDAKLLVLGNGTAAVGLTVTAFRERIDAMVRPPRGLLAQVPGIAGTTLLGDGGILLVLDLERLAA